MTSLPRGGAARQFSPATRRGFAVLGAVSAGLLVLSACDKPTAVATVTIGSDSVNSEATCWNGGSKIDEKKLQQCLQNKGEGDSGDGAEVKTVKVDTEADVHIGVDPKIADKGWTILMNGQPLTDASNKTFRTIPGSVFFNQQYGASGDSTVLSILENNGSSATGLWSFKLEKES
ncbi:DUF2771 domain-containing protein [Streptomyces fungicidicus]|uniref:DUF2771 domain-containing protein n=1 Tax=Streptomyces fungicidicus TaxID=68203 RepID=A0ACC7Y235_9ACTN|nr:DUF2771 domain-containing protein [Streptomyces fungicidicus]NUV75851.1 DUF2771 domain-containing protein [Streptomyces fungicidicus]